MAIIEIDGVRLDTDATYRVVGKPGVAWHLWGEATNRDWETGEDEPTGFADMTMVGDDQHFEFNAMDLTVLGEDEFCSGCGQIGCTAYGRSE